MDSKTYDELSEKLLAEAHKIELSKRPAYTTGSPDVLRNFKSVAERLGITPRQALAVYMLKHVDAVTSALKDPSIPQGEALEGRFCDLINYTKLAWALISEENDKPTPMPENTTMWTPPSWNGKEEGKHADAQP